MNIEYMYYTISLPLGSKPEYNLQRKKGLEEIPGIVSCSAVSYKENMATHRLFLYCTSVFKNHSYLSSASNSFHVLLPTCCIMKNWKSHTFQRKACNFP